MGRVRIRLIFTCLGLVALFAAVAIAHAAGPKIKSHTHTVSIVDGAEKSASARCPHGTKTIGGGARFKPVNLTSYLLRGAPTRRSWSTKVHQGTPGGGSKLVTSVLCIAGTKIIKRTHSKPLLALTVTTAKVSCPRHSVAVSGGVSAPAGGSNDNYMGSSIPVGKRSWKAGVVTDLSPAPGSKMRVTVLCVKGAKISHATASTDLFPDDNPFKLPATCSKGQVSGGGVSLSDAVNDYLNASYRKGRSWVGQATRRIGQVGNSRIKTYAVCLKSL